MAQEAWRAYLELALGVTEATTKKATKSVKRLVGKGGVSADQLSALADELVKTSTANREALTKLVRYELDRALGKVGLATAEEVADLTTRVRDLEAELRDAKRATPAVPAGEADAAIAAVAAATSAPTPIAKKTVRKVARKAPVPAEPVVAAEPLPAAEVVPATAVKQAPAKKTVAKKTVAKKTVAPAKVAAAAPTTVAAAKATRTRTATKRTPPAGGTA
jgi:polyhydroxyalkanoate synthesis regulator phasin